MPRAISPSPNRIRKNADNRSYVNYIHLHAQTIPLARDLRPVRESENPEVGIGPVLVLLGMMPAWTSQLSGPVAAMRVLPRR